MDATWRYALIGGVASIPLTLGLYWQSGMGDELSLNVVFLGGLLAGYLAQGTEVKPERAGVRAGLVGALPGLWMLYRSFVAADVMAGSTWFVVVALLIAVVGFPILLFGVSGVVGLLGAKVGSWLARKDIERWLPLVGN